MTDSLVDHSEALARIVETTAAAVFGVRGRHRRTIASAVLWHPGVLVTAAHVFRRPPQALAAVGEGGRSVEAALVGLDASTDLAVFKLEGDGHPAPPRLGDAAALKPGHLVVAVGRAADGSPSASHGIVNRSGGAWETWLGGQLDRLIRLDGGLYDGLSGAPVADAGGAVIGIATAALSRSHGIVVPASTVSRVVDALLDGGRVERPFLGIGAQPVPLDQAGAAGAEAGAQGLLVTALVPDGPAARGGLKLGDVLVAVDGRPAASLADLRVALSGRVGAEVPVSVLRGGQPIELRLTAAPWPARGRPC